MINSLASVCFHGFLSATRIRVSIQLSSRIFLLWIVAYGHYTKSHAKLRIFPDICKFFG